MIQKTNLEVKKAAILKAARASIRLKYALMADEEINQVLPELEARIDDGLQNGEPVILNPAHYLEA